MHNAILERTLQRPYEVFVTFFKIFILILLTSYITKKKQIYTE